MTEPVQEACPICAGARSTDPMYVEGPWRVIMCAECLHGWTVPSPSDLELMAAYESPQYYLQRGMVHSESATRAQAAALRARFSGSRLLDVGCGVGAMLAAARDTGFQVVGTEFSEHAAQIARTKRGLDVRIGSFSAAQFEDDERFDLITLIHVLEHVRDPRADLVAAHSLLAPRGRIFIEVPNPAAWAARYSARLRGRIHDLPLHLSHFSADSLERVLRQSGFGDVTVIVSIPNVIDRVLSLGSKIRRLAGPHSSSPASSGHPLGEVAEAPTVVLGDAPGERPTIGTLLTARLRSRFPGWKLMAIGAKNS